MKKVVAFFVKLRVLLRQGGEDAKVRLIVNLKWMGGRLNNHREFKKK